jgi:hypothetical protein
MRLALHVIRPEKCLSWKHPASYMLVLLGRVILNLSSKVFYFGFT